MARYLAIVLFSLFICINVNAETDVKSTDAFLSCSGKVVDSDGNGLGGAVIEFCRFAPGGSREQSMEFKGRTTSRSDGSFLFTSDESGIDSSNRISYIITARKSGYALGGGYWRVSEDIVDPIVLLPGRKLSGTVTNSKGLVISNAVATILPYAGDWVGFLFANEFQRYRNIRDLAEFDHFATVSDKSGRFEFDYMPVGVAVVIGIRTQDYPGKTIVFDAQKLDQPDLGSDSEVVLLKEGSISGVVIDDATNKPVEDIKVLATQERPSTRYPRGPSATSDSEGRFTLRCMPGKYTLMMAPQSKDNRWFDKPMDVEVKEGVDTETEFRISQGEKVKLTAVDYVTGEPIKDASIEFLQSGMTARDVRNVTKTDSEGVASTRLMAGSYRIKFHAFDYRNSEPEPRIMVVEKGNEKEVLLTMRSNKYRYFGNGIVDHLGESVAGVDVIVYNVKYIKDENRHEYEVIRQTVSDSEGKFYLAIEKSYFEQRGAGYPVIVFKADGYSISWNNISRSPFTVGKKIILREPKTYLLAVTDSSGQPIGNAKISAGLKLSENQYSPSIENIPELAGETDAQGRCRFSNFPITSRFDLTIIADGFVKQTIPSDKIKWNKDDVQEINATLYRTSTIKGRVIIGNDMTLPEHTRVWIKYGVGSFEIEPDGTFSKDCSYGKYTVLAIFPKGTLEGAVCKPVTVTVGEGETASVDLVLTKGKPVEVAVANYLDDSPVPNLVISLNPAGQGAYKKCISDEDGIGRCKLAPVEYSCSIQSNGKFMIVYDKTVPGNGSIKVTDSDSLQKFKLFVMPKSSVIGKASLPDGFPADGAEVYSLYTNKLLAKTASKGRFVFDNEATGHKGGLNGLLIRHKKKGLVSFRRNYKSDAFELLPAVTITGRLLGVDLNNTKEVNVEVEFKDNVKSLSQKVKVDDDGRFTIAGIPQSHKYELKIEADGYGTIIQRVKLYFKDKGRSWSSSTIYIGLESKGRRSISNISLDEEERLLDIGILSLEPRNLSMRGFLLDTNGDGVAGETVYLSGEDKELTTDENGRFTIEGLSPGKVYLMIGGGGNKPYSAGSQNIVKITEVQRKKIRRSDYLALKKRGKITSSSYPPYEVLDDNYSYSEPPLKDGMGKVIIKIKEAETDKPLFNRYIGVRVKYNKLIDYSVSLFTDPRGRAYLVAPPGEYFFSRFDNRTINIEAGKTYELEEKVKPKIITTVKVIDDKGRAVTGAKFLGGDKSLAFTPKEISQGVYQISYTSIPVLIKHPNRYLNKRIDLADKGGHIEVILTKSVKIKGQITKIFSKYESEVNVSLYIHNREHVHKKIRIDLEKDNTYEFDDLIDNCDYHVLVSFRNEKIWISIPADKLRAGTTYTADCDFTKGAN